ncbi:NAD(P)-dependent alcohol dehydrogenase [Amycolatopsis pithecellobii]|uniref:alcohol dehydrogenase (NADP(+)) n=1 Tax=Amycolatopsis pithecellobii TaxID=664692 RepID=A0A6N7YZG6_9PSEU|nr:NAD(P)-dependent alcohol dehydrogenase [Amycolatopsis pithecellobii]MTD57302.1 alcohol dehydrogenase catalytic domain-containing protein [Amycolatopsis pithecellobii]
MRQTTGWAVNEPGAALAPWAFPRRDLREDDVAVRIEYTGICGSDLHAVRHGDAAAMPLVPGHEMTGTVTTVGTAVTGFKAGDRVAVGNVVDSCGTCPACVEHRENWCFAYPTVTYGGIDRVDGTLTQGGFSSEYVAREAFVYHLPPGLDPAGAAPLLCAGATMFGPLRHWQAGPGKTVGIVGIGGLGHLGVKFAHALGAHVIAFTTSAAKAAEALELGADETILSTDSAHLDAAKWRCDLILDTVGVPHDINGYLRALKLDGTLCTLGIPPEDWRVEPTSLLYGAKRLTGGSGEGTRLVRDMLDFSAKHSITAQIELVPATAINTALDRLERGDVRYRFVVDMT